jgi:hypothetical protein
MDEDELYNLMRAELERASNEMESNESPYDPYFNKSPNQTTPPAEEPTDLAVRASALQFAMAMYQTAAVADHKKVMKAAEEVYDFLTGAEVTTTGVENTVSIAKPWPFRPDR